MSNGVERSLITRIRECLTLNRDPGSEISYEITGSFHSREGI